MPKDSESLNHKDNNNSKMLSGPQVEEVLISDEEQTESDDYETRLNEKLRDLGLFEDGMSIQQKEELLAVVVASWQTAEEEKTRRQFYQDYVNASEAFCNDQIEFSFKESPENHTPLYNANSQYFDIPMPSGSPSDSYSKDAGTKPLTPNGDISQSQVFTSDIASDSSLDNCDDTNCNASSSELFVASEGRSRVRRGKSKKGRATRVPNVAQSTANIKRVKDSQLSDKQPKNVSGEQGDISLWRPCSSPKEVPLSCPKRPWLTEPEKSWDYTEEELSARMVGLMKELNSSRLMNIGRFPPDRTLSKPYHLTRRGHFCKRTAKPDRTDILVGVTLHRKVGSEEPFSRTATNQYVPTNRTTNLVLNHRISQDFTSEANNFEAHTTRSGLKYGLYSGGGSSSKEMACDEDDQKWPPSEEAPLYGEVEVILDENLPKFEEIKPGLYDDGFAYVANEQVHHKFEGIAEAKNHSVGDSSETINHNANSSFVDNNSSDGSSVIDVETVVDEEIEEFVLKRKMLHDFQHTEKEPNASQSKRLKKTSS